MDTDFQQGSHHRKRATIGTWITVAAATGLAAGFLFRHREREDVKAVEEELDERIATDDRDDFAALRDEQVPGVDPLPPREPM